MKKTSILLFWLVICSLCISCNSKSQELTVVSVDSTASDYREEDSLQSPTPPEITTELVEPERNELPEDENSSAEPSESTEETSPTGGLASNQGRVIWDGPGCSFVIIETSVWYILAEEYSGYLSNGDIVESEDGNSLASYGFKNFKKNGNATLRVYVENYYGTKDRCFEWLKDRGKCGF